MLKQRVIWLLALVCLAVSVAPALAHEGREIGAYTIYFGWRVEPAYSGVTNGPEVFIEMTNGSEFSEDTPVDLSVIVSFGQDASEAIALYAVWGEVGHYAADLIPTLPGDYTFQLSGTIGDVEVNETFTSADGDFSFIEPSTDIFFPPLSSTEARVADLEARVAELEALIAELQASATP